MASNHDAEEATGDHLWARVLEVTEEFTRFQVNDVKPSPSDLRLASAALQFLLDTGKGRLVRHACSHADTAQILHLRRSVKHGLVAAALLAFSHHLPLILRPQHLWLAISQAIAMHVEDNAEALRHKFVTHQGKMTLVVEVTRQVLELASSKFPRDATVDFWTNSVENFVSQIKANTVEGVPEKIGCSHDFSNTTSIENVASMMTVMDCCKSFFGYRMATICGFPEITLEGTVQDWAQLRYKAETIIRELTLPAFADTWLPALLSVLDQFVSARSGAIDGRFWECMAKLGGRQGSGGYDWVSGWINVFLPLEETGKGKGSTNYHMNRFCVPFTGSMGQYERGGPDVTHMHNGLSTAPVDFDGVLLGFRAGFLGVEQREGGAVTPCVGWFVHTEENTHGLETKSGVTVPLS